MVKMTKKEQLLSAIEEVKKEIEDGKVTDLVMAVVIKRVEFLQKL